MDISAMLSNDSSSPPPAKLDQAGVVDTIKSTDSSGGLVDNEYKKTFESNINIINSLDKNLELSNAYKVLKFDEARLNSTMIHTHGFASNHIELDLHLLDSSKPLHHNTTRGREYKWGNTREVNKVEAKPKRKKPASSTSTPSFTPLEDSPSGYKSRAGRLSPTPEDLEDSPPSKRPKRKLTRDEDPEYTDGKSKLKTIKKEEDLGDDKKNSKEQKAVIKQYDNTYVAIWKDLSRKDGPKVSRLVQQSTQAKLINLKKTSILAAREAKRWQLKNNKSQKDLTTKARRAMREMFNFWKRNERIERELRKKHEKELIDKAKREEEEREAKRQSRKLNFLITQTELYSHFIGKKIKTEEIEGSDSDPNIKAQSNPSYDKYADVDGSKVHDIKTLDFDNDDDEFFNNAAAANARNALEATQSKAREFDGPNDDKNGEEMNFQNPTLLGDLSITQPNLLKCTLKEYQLKGLNWLANLYEQGINGILADEMGLGKTVQSISVLSYLAEHHNIWGPFLVVTPASTLHNWQQEITKFVPDFKVLPYWGNAKDRKVLRKFWDRKNVRYGKDAPFHVLVTSYQLVVADAAYFQKMKWQYMILDEAQAIKSSQSSRWKSLLSFSCRNRLLLTGTPIQNSMQELWALLHFIMPSLFDSHDEFSDWFSKDIESHAQSNTGLDEQQLRRLHMILKPFMLRRIKKNVQSELGDKVEIDIFCDLTNRQKRYYQMLKSQISIMDLLDTNASSNDDSTNLINLVMQFRKVCNHPDLFERADVKSSLSLTSFAETASFLRESNDIEVAYTTENLIHYDLPRLVYDEILTPSFTNDELSKQGIYEKFNVYHPTNTKDSQAFSWLRFVDSSPGELNQLTRKNVIQRAIEKRNYIDQITTNRFKYVYDEEQFVPSHKKFLISDYETPIISGSHELYDVNSKVYFDMRINELKPAAGPKASATPIVPYCSTSSYVSKLNDVLFDKSIRSGLMPLSLNTEYDLMTKKVPVSSYPPSNMLPQQLNNKFDFSNIRMPSMNRFITDSGKLAKLDQLLVELKQNDHRVLIYFQMTKMMDLMEEYLTFKQHTYIRLDGSSKLDDRRDLVHDWQTKPEIFIFLLSTRAGGLGINLTAADTVIFYDSDWNPTIDSQAMDRAHRLGQTRQVTVYRLLAKGTIEERMRDRAKQKEQVQQVVMEGKGMINKKEEAANKKKDVAFLLLGGDDDKLLNTSSTNSPAPETAGFNTKRLEEMYHEGEGKFSGTVTPSNSVGN
ncbi:uncharacterized protein CANTADRAFT_64469 [Suhomyces tanzawaensis NRRL Y-17324]|uniref:Chromatin-remodeling ATPase INO80 n=1 Tax=Suhomyces tanzawaensis NRRL Y-17324 TaxID=984487 RepID=A0A1E4SKN3_9ASCO|nr:uncharacterized protein CANTADRAFT_64469 [Suhomyces tanzawaensis NRRL Y-17324]ODV80058.1 hypothetical protein CANTADRAFT_64469 [Suhomyces tanzawaensis NRRL Y-17324]